MRLRCWMRCGCGSCFVNGIAIAGERTSASHSRIHTLPAAIKSRQTFQIIKPMSKIELVILFFSFCLACGVVVVDPTHMYRYVIVCCMQSFHFSRYLWAIFRHRDANKQFVAFASTNENTRFACVFHSFHNSARIHDYRLDRSHRSRQNPECHMLSELVAHCIALALRVPCIHRWIN